jgi:hypothetical protein
VAQEDLAPRTTWSLSRLNHRYRKHKELGLSTATIFSRCLAVMAVASVESYKHHKVTVEVFDGEAAIEVGSPTALDLHSTSAVGVGISGDQVVAGKICVRLECLDAFDGTVS